jgi:RNA polymerase sigma factor (TIGR02999 family)
LGVAQRLELFFPVGQASSNPHQGIVHKDLKPGNILVGLDDGRPVPKVIEKVGDFSLAKAMHQPLTEHTLHAADGVMIGTPLSMGPGQAEFNHLDGDTRTDSYAPDVVLYELLTGAAPLERRRVVEASWDERLRSITQEEPPRPSAPPGGGGHDLPDVAARRRSEPAPLTRLVRGELGWIVLKCPEKERACRYETANGLAGVICGPSSVGPAREKSHLVHVHGMRYSDRKGLPIRAELPGIFGATGPRPGDRSGAAGRRDATPMNDATRIFSAIERGDPRAAERLLPPVYDELRAPAARRLAHEKPGQSLQTTALVHDVPLRLVGPDPARARDGRGHFFAAAAEAMRRIVIDNERRKQAREYGGDQRRADLELDARVAPESDLDSLALDAAPDRLAQRDPQEARLVELLYFAGPTGDQAAAVLGICSSGADRQWTDTQAWLRRELGLGADPRSSGRGGDS